MYRIAKLTTVYPGFLDALATKDDAHQSYAALYERLVAQRFGWSDFFARHLNERGATAIEIFANARTLQHAWAREHAVRLDEHDWVMQVAAAQLRAFRPDVVFYEDLYCFDAPARARLRAALGPTVRVIGWRAAPTDDYTAFRDLDLILSFSQVLIDRFRAAGMRAAKISHGFATSLRDEVGPLVRDRAFTFAGQLGTFTGPHATRYALIEHLLPRTPLEVWGAGGDSAASTWAHRQAMGAAFRGARALAHAPVPARLRKRLPDARTVRGWAARLGQPGIRDTFPERCHGAAYGLAYYRLLARSHVTLNCHIDATSDDAGNMRLYEASGMGACVLTDWKPNLGEAFEPDAEVVVYRSREECVDKVQMLLRDEPLRRSIAEAGQRRTLRDHSIDRSVEALDQLIRAL